MLSRLVVCLKMFAALAAALTMGGCGPNTYGIAQRSTGELRHVSDADLCYGMRSRWRSAQMLQEVQRRNLDCGVGMAASGPPAGATSVGGGGRVPSGSAYVGIWQYRDKHSPSDVTHYLKITEAGQDTWRLIEGTKVGYEIRDGKSVYVADKAAISWRNRKLPYYEDPIIILRQSNGKVSSTFVSGVFRPTHSYDFTYTLTLTLASPDTLIHSVWSSPDGKRGDTKTFEATRVGGAAVPKGLSKSTGDPYQAMRIGSVANTSAIGGCSCYFSPVAPRNKSASQGYVFFADYAGTARININGRDVELREVGREQKKGELRRCSKKRCKYTGGGLTATVEYLEAKRCPPEPTECEVTGYDVTITVEKGGKQQQIKAKGECGC